MTEKSSADIISKIISKMKWEKLNPEREAMLDDLSRCRARIAELEADNEELRELLRRQDMAGDEDLLPITDEELGNIVANLERAMSDPELKGRSRSSRGF